MVGLDYPPRDEAMSFADYIHTVRNDPERLPARLLSRLDHEFRRVVLPRGWSVPSDYARNRIHDHRCRTERYGFMWHGRRYVCNYAPTSFDMRAARALLEAWLRRGLSDRFMDYQLVRAFENRQHGRPDTAEEAFEEMRANAPLGCVKFVANELPRSGGRGGLPVFGESITRTTTYDEVYSSLLIWDDYHLYGLVAWLEEMQARNGMGSVSLSLVSQGATLFVERQQRRPGTLYHRLAA